MDTKEFEGRTEQEAVAKAAAEIGSESFDVEVLEKIGGLLGRGGKVRIRVHPLSSIPDPMNPGNTLEMQKDKHEDPPVQREAPGQEEVAPPEMSKELKTQICEFLDQTIKNMNREGSVSFCQQKGRKIKFDIETEMSNVLIGRKGRTLDSLQTIANAYVNQRSETNESWKIILDVEGYRRRREETLTKMARQAAEEAVKTRSSLLLEPMNPFERRLIHTAISNRNDVVTESEGIGLYKRVRIISADAKRKNGRVRR